MVNQNDVRRIALSLAGAREGKDRFAFSVENKGQPKGFARVWLERVEPKKPRKLLVDAWRCQAPPHLPEGSR